MWRGFPAFGRSVVEGRSLSWGVVMTRGTQRVLCAALCAVAVAVTLLYAYVPTVDTPNTGDETMSMTMARMGYERGHPSYGYRADGEPRLLPVAVLMPITQYLYGLVMEHTPPLERIPRARIISRGLNAASLALCLCALVVAMPCRVRPMDWGVLAVGALTCLYMFVMLRSFCYVGSAARYDAAGLFWMSLFILCAGLSVADGSAVRVAVAGGVALAGLYVNQIPFLFGMAGFGCLLVLWLARHNVRQWWQLLFACAAMAGVCAVLFWAVARGLMHLDATQGAGRLSVGALVADLWARLQDMVTKGPFAYLRSSWQGKAADMMATSMVCAIMLLGLRITPRDAKASTVWRAETVLLCLLWPLAVAAAAHALPHPRFTYETMLLTAVVPPLFMALLRSGAPGLVRFALACAALAMLSVVHSASDIGYRGQYLGTSALMDGFRGMTTPAPWDAENIRQNAVRRQHLESLEGMLSREDIGNVLVFDPMLALFDGDGRRMMYLWDAVPPEHEEDVLGVFRFRYGVRHVVVSEAGTTSWLEPVGLPGLERALLDGVERGRVTRLGERARVDARLVFTTAAIEPELRGVRYSYSHAPSTPLHVFAVRVSPRGYGGP